MAAERFDIVERRTEETPLDPDAVAVMCEVGLFKRSTSSARQRACRFLKGHFEAGAWGVFGVQNAGEAGVEREEAQGKRLAIPGS